MVSIYLGFCIVGYKGMYGSKKIKQIISVERKVNYEKEQL